MQPFKSWNASSIIVSAILGGIHAYFAALQLRGESISLWEIGIPVTSGAAISASTGSALCRFYKTWQLIRDNKNRPSDHSLCYRGVRTNLLVDDLEMNPQLPEPESADDQETTRTSAEMNAVRILVTS